MAYQTFILRVAYPKFNGVPASGVVEVIPGVPVVVDAAGNKILSGRVKEPLEADGTVDIELPHPGDTSLNPAGFPYTIVAKLHHAHLPAVTFGADEIVDGVVELAKVTTVDPALFDPVVTYAPSSTVTALDARVTTLEETPGGVTSYLELTDKPTIPATAEDVGALPAAETDTTVAALAQDPESATGAALSATYAAIADVQSIATGTGVWIPATDFGQLSGAPTQNTLNGFPVWRLQPSLTEVIGTMINFNGNLPDLVDIDIVWSNTTANAGTVQLQARWTAPLGSGSNLASPIENTNSLLLTAPTVSYLSVATIAKAVTLAPGASRITIRTIGTGTLATNDVAILGAWVRPSVRLPESRKTTVSLPGALSGTQRYNVTAFTRDNVVTVDDDQYAVWINDATKPIIGKRTRTAGEWGAWSTFDLSTVAGNPLGVWEADGHNNICLGVDSSGRIQVAANHHDDPLHILRSLDPGDITAWAEPNLTGIPSANRNSVTYPQFITDAAGDLWLWLRQGGSGAGAMFLNKWDATNLVWNHMSRPLSGFVVDGATVDESPYVNTPVIDAAGVWHLFFMWRETDDLATTHDFGYMKSTDGINWTTANGTALGAITNPQEDDAALIFTGFADQINQNGAVTDSSNRPHAVMWVRSPASTGPSYLRHYWWDGSAWQQHDEAVAPGASPTFRSRVTMLAYGGKVFALYADHPTIGVNGAGHPRSFSRWWLHDVTVGNAARIRPFIFHEETLGYAELTYDWRGLAADGLLNMLATTVVENDPAYAAMPGKVITLDVADLVADPPA